MSNDNHDPEALTAIVTLLFAVVVGLLLLNRHPRRDTVPTAGRRFTVAAVPRSGERLPQTNPHPTDVHHQNHIVHLDYRVAALEPPSPPPNYLEYPRDTRIDGAVPSYSNTSNSRGGPVGVVPTRNTNPPPAENADLDEDEDEDRSNV
ncbi:hypothetical protein FRC00_006830 [Tulasnella sp. 408]|nr:hypothetical protein FRC00_006830 [Tulasnella sp. 408]